MDVQLQVVGLFYNVMLTLPESGQTVKDVMDAAMANPRGNSGSINGAKAFKYGTHLDARFATATMSGMSTNYDAKFQSRVLTNYYDAGIYTLAESFDPTMPKAKYSVWQYYLFDQDGKFMPGQTVEESFVTRPIDNVSRVTWRLVTILGGPTGTEADLGSLANRNPTVRAAPAV